MPHRLKSLILRAVVVVVCCPILNDAPVFGQEPSSPPTGGTHLFDGATLDNWEGDPKYWRVANDAIVGEIPKGHTLNKNTWLVW